MIKKLFTLLLSLCAMLPLTAQNTLWEGQMAFLDYGYYIIIPAEKLQQVADGNTLTLHYENFDESQGILMLYDLKDNNWNLRSTVDSYTEGLEKPNGSYTFKFDDSDAAKIREYGIVINGIGFTLNKITFEAGKPNRYIHDMIWFENSNFETITDLNVNEWNSKWSCFPQPTCEASTCKEGYNSPRCLKLKLNEATEDVFNAVCNYNFDAPLAPGDYKISFRARADHNTTLTTLCQNDSYSGDGYHQFDINTSWETYEFDFNTTSDDLVRLVFHFGNSEPAEIYIDDLRFGPYLAEKPDKNILFQGSHKLNGNNGAPLFLPDNIKAGNVLRFTFSDLAPYNTGLYLASIADSEIINPQIYASLPYDNTVEIGITERTLDAVKRGIKLCDAEGTLTEIRVIRDVFEHSDILTYGRRICHYDGDYVMSIDVNDLVNPDKPNENLLPLAVVTQGPSSTVPCLTNDDRNIGIWASLPSPTVTNSDGSVIYTFFIEKEYLSKFTGNIIIKDLDSPILYTFRGRPFRHNLYLSENTVCIWDRPFSFFEDNRWMKLDGALFNDMKEGDKLAITMEKVRANTNPIYLYTGNWNRFIDSYFAAPENPMLGADGRTMWTHTMTAEEIEDIKSNGIILSGYTSITTGVYIDYAEKPADNPLTLFMGSTTLSDDNNLSIPLDGVKAGDVMRVYFGYTSDNEPLRNISIKTSDGLTNASGVAGISSTEYFDCHTEIGITNELLKSCGESLTLTGREWTINKVEIIPGVFEPDGMICYGRRTHSLDYPVSIPAGTEELILTVDEPSDMEVVVILVDAYNRRDYRIFELHDANCTASNGDGTASISIPLTADNIETVNRAGGMRIYHTLPILSIHAVGDTSGIEEITGNDTDAPAVYYNMQGVRVDTPTAPGIYIRRQGNTATKIQVK